jgi:hypothetical protein
MTLIQQNTARAKATPRSVSDLEAELQRHDSILLTAQRGRSAARVKIPDLMTSGDSQGIEDCRKEIARLDAQIVDFTERREQTQDAIRAAKNRDRAAYQAQDYREIRKEVAAFKTDAFRMVDTLEAFGKALLQLLAQQDAMESKMRNVGVTPDPYVIRIKLLALVEMNLFMETNGVLGQKRSLLSVDELKSSPQSSSIKRAANEAHELFTRQLRHALGISNDPEAA